MIRLFLAVTAVVAAVTTTGLAVASDRHHHHSHFGSHYHRSHGYHYGLHSYTHSRGHYGSRFGFGLSLGRSYRNYGYTTPIYNGYSYSSRNRYYSNPTYRYSSPSCVIQSTTVVPRREVIGSFAFFISAGSGVRNAKRLQKTREP